MALSKQEIEVVNKQISSIILNLKNNPIALWNITLHRTKPTVGIEWMQEQGWKCCRNSKLTKKLRSEVNELLREEGVIIDGWKTDLLNTRRKILAWWLKLSDLEKQNLEHFQGGRLILGCYVSIPNTKDPKLRLLVDEINDELTELGNFGCPQMTKELAILEKNPINSWKLPLSSFNDDSKEPKISASMGWLREKGWEFSSSSKATKKIRLRISKLLREEGIILDGWELDELNKRRKILAWWKSLSDEDKRGLKFLKNGRISLSQYLPRLDLVEPKLKIIIDEINEEVNQLGNFGCPHFTTLISALKSEPLRLWEVPLSSIKSTDGKVQVSVSFIWLKENGWPYNLGNIATNKLCESLNELLRNEGVIIDGGSSADLNFRRKLLAWWKPLSKEEKLQLKYIIANKLVISHYVKGIKARRTHVHYHHALNQVHDELIELGVLERDYVKMAERLGPYAERRKKMNEVIQSFKDSPSLLWNIPLSNSATNGALPSSRWIEEQGLKTSQTVSYREFLNELTKLLREEGVIINGWKTAALDMRRKILAWWKPLTEEDKRGLKNAGNKLSIHNYIKGLRWDGEYSKLKEVLNEINAELLELQVLNKDYVAVADRAFTREAKEKKQKHNNQKQEVDKWKKLIKRQLHSVDDLLSVHERDYAQVRQLIAAASRKVTSESGKSNFSAACEHFTSYLSASSVPRDSRLESILNPYILLRFKQDYILPLIYSNKISPLWANTVMSCIKISLVRAKQIKGLHFSTFIEPGLIPENESKRTTEMYKPYSPSLRNQITKAIEKDIFELDMLLQPYQKTGIGSDPFDENQQVINGKGTIDNARYIFENYLDCSPVYYFDNSPYAQGFLRIIGKTDLGLHGIYKEWGVIPIVSKEMLLPLLYKLAQVTGMNADSLLELDIDDYVESHHATGKPCLRYWKERSEGGKEYHLDIFDAEIQWLTTLQSKLVKSTIDIILKVTARVRDKADEPLSSKLFICESASTSSYLTPIRLSSLSEEYKKFAIRHNIKGEDGKIINVNIARFRPTFVSELVDKGVSMREIQLLLGHKYISTTMNYLDRLDFNKVARIKVKEALLKIKGESDNSNQVKPKVSRNYKANKDNIIFTTPLGGCANIFNPPDFIKKSSMYVEGRPCSQYNKCLSCDNVLITIDHLPELFAMRRDYLQLMKLNRVMDTPYGLVIDENLSLLDEILSVKKSDFAEDELREGERRSQFVETTILDDVGA